MTTLLGSLLPRRSATGYGDVHTFQDWLGLVMSFAGHQYPLLNQTLKGDREEVVDGYDGLARQYRGNAVIFACMGVRMRLFSEARFQWQRMTDGRPGDLFWTPALEILERPWPTGQMGDLLGRMIQHADIGGNTFVVRRPRGLRVVRPDWVTMVLGSHADPDMDATDIDAELIGIAYHPGGREQSPKPTEVFLPGEFAHWAPIPDPLASFRGMSWLTPIIREIAGDNAATSHKLKFFENGATPNMVVSLDPSVLPAVYDEWRKRYEEQEPKGRDAYKTLYLGGGADVTVVGSDLKQLDFKITQGHGETRIAAAAGVPPVIVGLSEGLQAATYSNYGQARRSLADNTMHPAWRSAGGALEDIVTPRPADARLWVDTAGIPFLREDRKDQADIQGVESRTIRTLVDAGYDAESVVAAVNAQDWSLLRHSGLFSVQLQPPMPDGPAPVGDPGRALASLIAPHLAGLLAPPAPNGDA